MDEQLTAVAGIRPPEVARRRPLVPFPRTPDGPATGSLNGEFTTPAAHSLLGRPGAAATGGTVPTDDDLLERTLRFSGSYVSDDGHLTVRRAASAMSYSAAGFLGHCEVCVRAGRTPPAGEPLPDVRAAVQFVAGHEHGNAD